MKKIWTGPMEFTPYRPWSSERREAARARWPRKKPTHAHASSKAILNAARDILEGRPAPMLFGDLCEKIANRIDGASYSLIGVALHTSCDFKSHGKRIGWTYNGPPTIEPAPTPPVSILAPWSEPTIQEIESRNGPGWNVIKFIDDLPFATSIMVSGEDHHEFVVRLQPLSEYEFYPWSDNHGRRWRWDLFDWWRPMPPNGNDAPGQSSSDQK